VRRLESGKRRRFVTRAWPINPAYNFSERYTVQGTADSDSTIVIEFLVRAGGKHTICLLHTFHQTQDGARACCCPARIKTARGTFPQGANAEEQVAIRENRAIGRCGQGQKSPRWANGKARRLLFRLPWCIHARRDKFRTNSTETERCLGSRFPRLLQSTRRYSIFRIGGRFAPAVIEHVGRWNRAAELHRWTCLLGNIILPASI